MIDDLQLSKHARSLAPKVSVIIPVFNAVDYLELAARSVLEQSYKNIELILVDDKSTDSSLQLCLRLADEDDRVCVIENSENGGSGYSKNVGVNAMTGDAICFVDDDDYLVSETIIEECVQAMSETNAQMACFGWCDDEPELGRYHYVCDEPYLLGGAEATEKMLRCDGADSNPWCKLYMKSVWGDLRFPVGMVYDDANVTYKAFLASETVVHLGVLGYSHRNRTTSISGSVYKEKDWDYIINVKKTVSNLQDASPGLKKASEIMLSQAAIDLLLKYGRGGEMPREKRAYLTKEYNKNYDHILRQCVSMKDRILMRLVHHHMICVIRAYHMIKRSLCTV